MSNITDSIVLALTLYFLYRGWAQGLLRTLLGPISLILGCLVAMIYYAQNHHLLIALLISIVAPFILNILFSLALTLWNKGVNADRSMSTLSRISAAVLSFIWGGINLLLIIILVTLIPVSAAWMEKTRQDIFNSRTYALVAQGTKNLIPAKPIDIKAVSQVLQDPEQLRNVQSSPEYQAVWQDTTIQELFADPQIAKNIEAKNFAGLMTNPKIQAIMENPELVKKILDLNMKVIEQNTPTGSVPSPGR